MKNKLTGQKYSKNKILAHDFANVIKDSYWIFIVLICLYFILIPFSTAGIPGQSVFDIEVTHAQMKFRFINESFIFVTYCFTVISGVFTALYMFKFLRSKRETTILMSLGMTRWNLFISRALTGMGILVVSIFIPMTVSLLLNKMALGVYTGMVERWLYLSVGISLVALTSYFITVVACMISGTLTEAVLFGSTILSFMTLILYGINTLVNKLKWGGARGIFTYSGNALIKKSLVDEFRYLNPLIFFYNDLTDQNKFLRTSAADFPMPVNTSVLWFWAVIILFLFGLSYILLKYRKAEITGMNGGCIFMTEIVIGVSAFITSVVIFAFFYDMIPAKAFVMGAAVFIAVHFVWRRTLFKFDSKFVNKAILCFGELLVVGFIVIFLITDNFGSTRSFLEKSEIASARISYVGSPSYFPDNITGSSSANGFYMQGKVMVSDPDEIKSIIKIHKEIQEEGKHKKQLNKTDFTKTVVPYDIEFSYRDNFGKEHSWYYDRASLSQLSKLLDVDNFNSVKKDSKRVIEGTLNTDSAVWAEQAYMMGDIYISDSRYAVRNNVNISKEERKELLSCISADVYNQTLEERYYPDKESRCIIMFSRSGDTDIKEFKFHMNNAFVHVTDSFTNTINWLNDHKLMPSDEYEIESISLQKFNPYESINGLRNPMSMYFMSYRAEELENFIVLKDFGEKYKVTGRSEIRQLEKGLRNTWFMDEGGYLAAVKLKDVEGYSFEFIPEDQVPSFVVD